MTPTARIALLALPISLAACGTEDVSGDDGSTETEARVTYYDDVLPILTTRCQSCHSDGGIGPFVVDDYEEAKAWAPAMAASVRSRTMPPFSVDASGTCNDFADAQWLDESEIETIETWVSDGMEMGNEDAERVPMPKPIALDNTGAMVSLFSPEAYAPVAQDYPGGEFEDYQCFLAEYDADQDRFLTGFDVIPGNLATVHHVLVMEVDPAFAGNAAQMQALDDASPDQRGWDCFGAAGEDVIPEGVPVAWAPGTGAVNYPDGTGIRIEAGHQLVIQMHYNLINDDGSDTTEIQLAMADEVEREGKQSLVDPFLFSAVLGNPESLPPGQERTSYTWEMSLNEAMFEVNPEDEQIDVYGLLPHMHERGLSMHVEYDVAGQTQCGANVDRWDFNWQRMYFYDEPIPMTYGDTLRVTCDYTTMGDTDPVLPGFGTSDEMCLVGMYVVPR